MSDEEKTRRRREKLVKILSNLFELKSHCVVRLKRQHKISIRVDLFLVHRVNSLNFFIFDRQFGILETIQRSISVDPLQLSTERTQARRPLTPNPSLDLPSSPQSPPPVVSAASPPPPPPPPPPAPPAPPASGDADRTHLLSSITDFSMAKLKKAKTNDRSAPKVK